jgi:glycosyltransferase involved in cell wall biosynthesis
MKEFVGKRVLFLIENTSYPQDTRIYQMATALTNAGYHATVISPARKGQPYRDVMDGVHLYRYAPPPGGSGVLSYMLEYGYSLLATFALTSVVAYRHGFDVIHAANPPDLYVLIALFFKMFGVRFIFDHHDLAPEMYWEKFSAGGNQNRLRKKITAGIISVLKWWERFSCRMADHVIATNESFKKIELERDQIPEQKITVVRNGPSTRWRNFDHAHLEQDRQAGFVLGYVGVIGFLDGLDYLLRALRHLKEDFHHNDFSAVIVGQGDALESLREMTTALGLDQQVRFTGWLSGDELVRCLDASTICVDPDPSNSVNDHCTMIKIMEYMALGKPIVAFDLPEHRYSAEEAAVYARPNDEMDFARKIAWLMDHPEECRWRGEYGKTRVETCLSWEDQSLALLSVYAQLEQRRARDRSGKSTSGGRMNL